jgi:hypothetical protein
MDFSSSIFFSSSINGRSNSRGFEGVAIDGVCCRRWRAGQEKEIRRQSNSANKSSRVNEVAP